METQDLNNRIELMTKWERIGNAGQFDVSTFEDDNGDWYLEWLSDELGWQIAAEGSLEYCLGYVDGRIDGEGL